MSRLEDYSAQNQDNSISSIKSTHQETGNETGGRKRTAHCSQPKLCWPPGPHPPSFCLPFPVQCVKTIPTEKILEGVSISKALVGGTISARNERRVVCRVLLEMCETKWKSVFSYAVYASRPVGRSGYSWPVPGVGLDR